MAETGAIAETPVDIAPPGDGGVPDSELSADAIFDKYAPTEPAPATEPTEVPEAKPTETKPATEQAAEPKAEGEQEDAVEPFIREPEPEEYKKAFKSLQKYHPDVAKNLRNSYYENKAYHETFTVPEVREIKQLFPSVAEAKEARGAMADLLTVEELLTGAPDKLLGHIQARNPQAFLGLASAMPDLMYQMDPALYRAQVSEPAVRNHQEFFLRQAQQTGDEELHAAIEIIRDREARMFGTQAQQPRPQADRAMLDRLNRLESERDQLYDGQVNYFKGAIDNSFDQAVKGEVAKMIERSGADVNENAINEIYERVLGDTKDGLLADQVLQRRLNYSATRGRKDATHQKETLDLLLANAKRFIPQATSKHLRWMTEEILGLSAEKVKKAAAVQQTKSVSGAVPGTSGKQPLTKDQVEKLSDDELFEAAANGMLG